MRTSRHGGGAPLAGGRGAARAAAATSLVAARIARETGGFLLPADGADDAAANVLEAWARLHGGRRTLRSAVSATGRRPSVTVVRGLRGRPLRVLVDRAARAWRSA